MSRQGTAQMELGPGPQSQQIILYYPGRLGVIA